MTVYIDLIVIANFLLDYSLIAYTGIINKQKQQFLRLFLASVFAVGGLGLLFIKIKILFFLLRILYSLVIIYIAFSYTTIKEYTKNFIVFYFLNYVTAGFLISFKFDFTDYFLLVNQSHLTTWYLLIISFIFANLLTYIYKVIEDNNKYYQENIIECSFRFLNQDYHVKGLLDTGNRVESIGDRIPIVFINKNLFNKNIDEVFLINNNIPFTYVVTNTINSRKLLLAFKPDAFYIFLNNKKCKRDVYIVLIDNLSSFKQKFQVILNYKMLN